MTSTPEQQQDTPAAEPVTERWAYAGSRVSSAGKLIDAWLDPTDGEELWFARKGRWIIGSFYEVKVVRNGERVSRHGDPVWTGDSVDDERRRAWAAKDMTARTRVEQRRRHDNAAKADALTEAMAPLLAIAATCRTGAERDALAATVMRRLFDAKYNPTTLNGVKP